MKRRDGKIYFYLDDLRPNPDPNLWQLFKTSVDLLTCLQGMIDNSPDLSNIVMSLDHDLGYRNNNGNYSDGTGYDVVVFLEMQSVNLPGFVMPEVRIHSSNPVGRAKMQNCLDSIKKRMG